MNAWRLREPTLTRTGAQVELVMLPRAGQPVALLGRRADGLGTAAGTTGGTVYRLHSDESRWLAGSSRRPIVLSIVSSPGCSKPSSTSSNRCTLGAVVES